MMCTLILISIKCLDHVLDIDFHMLNCDPPPQNDFQNFSLFESLESNLETIMIDYMAQQKEFMEHINHNMETLKMLDAQVSQLLESRLEPTFANQDQNGSFFFFW